MHHACAHDPGVTGRTQGSTEGRHEFGRALERTQGSTLPKDEWYMQSSVQELLECTVVGNESEDGGFYATTTHPLHAKSG